MNQSFCKQLLFYTIPFCFHLVTSCSNIDSKEIENSQRETSIAYFASKKNNSLTGSGEVKVGENELFFYGFSTDNKELTRYVQPKIPLTLIALHKKKSAQYTDDLANAMQNIIIEFYKENKAINPCNTQTQHMLISLLHLCDTEKTISTLECIDGQFKEIYKPIRCIINPLQIRNCFLPIAKAGASKTGIQSDIYTLIKKNPIVQKSMYERPQELVNKIIEADTNHFLENIIYVSESEWMKRCKHPSTTKEYQTLKTKWALLKKGNDFESIVKDASELEISILSHWNHNKSELLKFAAVLRQHAKANPSQLLFVDNLIEQAPEAPKVSKSTSSCIAGLCSLYSHADVG